MSTATEDIDDQDVQNEQLLVDRLPGDGYVYRCSDHE